MQLCNYDVHSRMIQIPVYVSSTISARYNCNIRVNNLADWNLLILLLLRAVLPPYIIPHIKLINKSEILASYNRVISLLGHAPAIYDVEGTTVNEARTTGTGPRATETGSAKSRRGSIVLWRKLRKRNYQMTVNVQNLALYITQNTRYRQKVFHHPRSCYRNIFLKKNASVNSGKTCSKDVRPPEEVYYRQQRFRFRNQKIALRLWSAKVSPLKLFHLGVLKTLEDVFVEIFRYGNRIIAEL
ncbi:hypothetical protein WN51_02608 [Melipona quadrifasciata]|uniref:Uncharacterized protein n=1 Tax=Melipona quadrifasciata TaxID=166423 RepID=A0A0N0U3R5_9HYME|nr:hypothetical protein WN51_02608 [Melipona quadrifasciata]